MKPTSQTRPKMTRIHQISIEIKLSFNELKSEIFQNLDVDYQMSLSCDQYRTYISPQNAYFSCVIGVYLRSLFFEHPVEDATWVAPGNSKFYES